MGPNVKFVSPICDLISERKIGVIFLSRAIVSPKFSDELKYVLMVQYNFPGVFKAKVRQIHVRAQIWFNLLMALFRVLNFQLILNQISPPGNPHWH